MQKPVMKRGKDSRVINAPPEADYSDEVTLEQLARLQEHFAHHDCDNWEKVGGPAW